MKLKFFNFACPYHFGMQTPCCERLEKLTERNRVFRRIVEKINDTWRDGDPKFKKQIEDSLKEPDL